MEGSVVEAARRSNSIELPPDGGGNSVCGEAPDGGAFSTTLAALMSHSKPDDDKRPTGAAADTGPASGGAGVLPLAFVASSEDELVSVLCE